MSSSPRSQRPFRVLVVDDESNIRLTLTLCLEAGGHQVTACASADEAMSAVRRHPFDLIFLDVRLGVASGLDLIPDLLAQCPWGKVVVITAYASAETAIAAMDRGASDYLPKPFTPAQVQLVVRKVQEQRKLEMKLGAIEKSRAAWDADDAEPLTTSSEMRQAVDLAHRLASGDTTLLIKGEPGTGKDRLARAIHQWSPRRAGACVSVSCAAASADALDEELFGVGAGGGDGVSAAARGAAALCDGGTLILRQVGAAPLALQPRLVRLVREREYERHEEFVPRRTDVRVVATTTEDLDAAAATGRLRRDLLMAINIVPIELPPLRRRPEDIRFLAERFRQAAATQARKDIAAFTPEAMDILIGHGWPGNVRELRGVIERAVNLCASGRISLEHLPPAMLSGGPVPEDELLPLEALQEMHIRRVLQTAKSMEAAAAILGIDPATLWRRRKLYKLD